MKSHVFVFLFVFSSFFSSFHVEPCAFEEHHRGTESGSLNGRSYFFFCADDIRMIRAPRNNQHSGRSFNGRWAFCMNQCFILLQHQSSFFFFSSVFSFTPSYLSIVMNLLLTTWPLPFIPSNFLYYLSLSYYLLGLTFFLLLMDYCPGGMRAEVTENTI